MKIFSGILRRKRGVLLFVAAFVLPLLFGVLISIDNFSKRYKTNQSLLQSNLWFEGRAALDRFELEFSKIETDWLSSIPEADSSSGEPSGSFSNVDPFIIDSKYDVVFPVTGQEESIFLGGDLSAWNDNFKLAMDQAESKEFSGQDLSLAVIMYKESLALAHTVKERAIAIARLARTYTTANNTPQALKYYQDLQKDYSHITNQAGHPYGLIAPLQLYNIGAKSGDEDLWKDDIQHAYQLMRKGAWPINKSSFRFFSNEFESILGIEGDPGLSVYECDLELNEFLRKYIIPQLADLSLFPGIRQEEETKRILVQTDNFQYLVCYRPYPDVIGGSHQVRGIRIDQDTILDQVFPAILSKLDEDSDLEFSIRDENQLNILSNKIESIGDNSLSLPIRDLPFGWNLYVSEPGFQKLESDMKTQILIYGLLLLLIIILMFFGVFMLIRDISRESGSMLMKTEFVHNVSHELKTPLSLIRLYGETLMIKENLPDEDRKDALQIITKESERLSHMINNILDFSKIEMGRKEFDFKPGNLSKVVIETINSYRYHLLRKGFTIDEEIDDNIRDIPFDKNAVEGILINLFSNSIKFSIDNRMVKISLKRITDKALLEISDKGIGISEKDQKNIFERFYRARQKEGFEARGSGLGLTLVKHAVDAHSWQISVDSKPGQGSKFQITIPLHSSKNIPE